MKPLHLVLVAIFAAAPMTANAQGLAAAAKKEEARRKDVKDTGKVYTNVDLTRDITPSTGAASNATPGQPAPSTQVPQLNLPAGKADIPADEQKKDEKYWRERMNGARSALERTRIFADALQSRLNALATDIINRDDPAQRSQLELERQRAIAELDRVKKEMADQSKAIADLEEEARKAGVPPGWLR
jgi:hypothetical protein